jgi:hypothetical protein
MSGADGTCLHLREELGVETVRVDFDGSLATDVEPDTLPSVNQHGAVALGLALKEFGKDAADLDFRKGPYRYEHRFNRLKFPLLLLSVLAFLFFLQTAYWAYNEHQRLGLLEYHLDADVNAVYEKFFEEKPVAGLTPFDAAKRKVTKWKTGGLGNVGKVVDAVAAIRNVGEVLKDTGLLFKTSSMKFEFVLKSRATGGSRRPTLRPVSDSKVDIVTETRGADVTIGKAFAGPKSKFFSARTSVQPTKDGYKISITLSFKPAALKG